MPKKWRVFLDTSAILAGLNSPSGAAGTILRACFSGEFNPVISPQIIEEAEDVIPLKFPGLASSFVSFLLLPPEITSEPNLSAVRDAYKLLPTSDAPILASALEARPDVLVTWNTRDFLRPEVVRAVPFPIFRPGEFLHFVRQQK